MILPPPKLSELRVGTQLIAGLSHSTIFADIDFETYSPAGSTWNNGRLVPLHGARTKGLPAVGAKVYSEHPETEVLSCAYNLKDGTGAKLWTPTMMPPIDLFAHLARGGLLEAWYSMFEFLIWNNVCVRRYNWPPLPLVQLRCAMAKARAFGLPGSLANAGEVLQTSVKKDREGKRLLDKFSMPRQPTIKSKARRIYPADSPADAHKLYMYNLRDIEAEAEISSLIPDLIPSELEFWLCDQRLNARGVAMDRKAIEDCIAIIERAYERYNAELATITDGQVKSASEVARLITWLKSQGLHTETLDDEKINQILNAMDVILAPDVKRALEIRQLIGSAAVKKLYAMINTMSSKDRIHDLFMYHSARTGRAAGVGVQPQNLPNHGDVVNLCACKHYFNAKLSTCPWCGRSDIQLHKQWHPQAVEHALEAIATRNLDCVEYIFGNAISTVSGCLRGLFIAPPGYDLICSDYNAIEAVVLACLANEKWRIDVFKTHGKIYEMSASKLTGIPFEEFELYKATSGEHHPKRKLGKVSELACITHDTQVLTDRGYVAVMDVRVSDKLWDGEQWVTHSGVIKKGKKSIVNLDGIEITPNHPISLGHSWTEAGLLVSNENMLIRALAIGSAKLPIISLINENLPKCKKESGSLRYVYDIVNAGDRNRFTVKTDSGHLIIHNSGYGGWCGAWEAFGANEFLIEEEIKRAILAWRDASPAIVSMWHSLEYAANQAVLNPGTPYYACNVSYIVNRGVLYCQLPSGRTITYHKPELHPSERRPNTQSLSFETWNTNPKYGAVGWVRLPTYGGKLCENVVQAVARDILAHAIVNLEREGYPVVLHIHDEIVVEVPEGHGSVAEVERIMSAMPAWANDWPVRASGGWRAKRYTK